MSKHRSSRAAAYRRWLIAWRGRVLNVRGLLRQVLGRWRRRVPIEVLVVDRTRRRTLERELRWGLGRLRRGLGEPFPPELTVLVQQVIRTDRQLAGCYLLGHRSDGSQFALVRLALQVDGNRLSTDDLLAVLAEQLIGLATQQNTSVLVPIDLAPAPVPVGRTTPVLPADPLASHTNGTNRGNRAA